MFEKELDALEKNQASLGSGRLAVYGALVGGRASPLPLVPNLSAAPSALFVG